MLKINFCGMLPFLERKRKEKGAFIETVMTVKLPHINAIILDPFCHCNHSRVAVSRLGGQLAAHLARKMAYHRRLVIMEKHWSFCLMLMKDKVVNLPIIFIPFDYVLAKGNCWNFAQVFLYIFFCFDIFFFSVVAIFQSLYIFRVVPHMIELVLFCWLWKFRFQV